MKEWYYFQGIVAFHQGHRSRAAQALLGVETELRALDVPDDALAEVVALGFTDKEAREGFIHHSISADLNAILSPNLWTNTCK